MCEDIRPAVNFGRRLVLRQVRNSVAAKARDLVLIDDMRFSIGVGLFVRRYEKTFKIAHEIKFLSMLFIVIFVSEFAFVWIVGVRIRNLLRFVLETFREMFVEDSLR